MPALDLAGLSKTSWSDHLVRFVFGGVVTVATGVIASQCGPTVGGLFLAFPAILPASLTLLTEHDGRRQAVHAAAGSRLGAIALIAFAVAVSRLAERGAVVSLLIATLVWIVLACLLWEAVYGFRGA